MSQQHFNIDSAIQMAYQLYESKSYHQCADICIQILSIDCTRADIWNLAGIVALELKIYERAIEYFTQASKYEPKQVNHKLNLAEAYRRSGNPKHCIEELEASLLQESTLEHNSTFHFNLAKAYSDLEDSQNSIKHYAIAIKLDPNDLGAMFNLANAQVSIKQFGEAIELYLSALNRGYLDAGVNLAHTYVQIGLFSKALEVYAAIYQYYKNDADFLFNYANALNYANADMQLTQTLYQQAIALNPAKVEYCINYAHFLLRHLHFEQGFRIYEERKKLPQMLPQGINNIWQYNLESKGAQQFEGKKVLVYHEQGLGDSIMFARFLPLLQKYAQNVSIIVQQPLLKFFQMLEIPSVSHRDEEMDFDVAISLLSLPLALGVSNIQDLHFTPFMMQSQDKHQLESENKKVRKIGICFSTDSEFPEAANKNIPLEVLMSALEGYKKNHNIEIYSLNKAQHDTDGLGKYGINQLPMEDFVDTFHIIKDMDMVISIDTAVAHLSASVGKHTIVLLNKRYDWRWGNGIFTPWYEDVVCMTQSKMNDWSNVAQNLKAYLKAWI